MNDNGEVVGDFPDAAGVWHGFLRDARGNYTILDAPEAGTAANEGTFAKVINATGQIAGYYADSNTVYHGFIRDSSGNYTSFDAPGGGVIPFTGTQLDGINSTGEIAGYYFDKSFNTHSYFRDASGTITDFDVPGATVDSSVATNDSGTILGAWAGTGFTTGFLRTSDGSIGTFSVPTANNGTGPTSINNKGHVTGWYLDSSSVTHGFVF
jgi:hypothetical protein